MISVYLLLDSYYVHYQTNFGRESIVILQIFLYFSFAVCHSFVSLSSVVKRFMTHRGEDK